MLITKASEYAILSLIVLSKAEEPMDSETLSRELAISKSFLAKILQALAKAGILKSYKGVNGGFALNKDAKEIQMLDVMSSVEGKAPAVFECAPSESNCPSDKASSCSIWPFLNKLQGKAPAVFECAPSESNCPSDKASSCSIWPFLNKLQGKIDSFLSELTLADIIEE